VTAHGANGVDGGTGSGTVAMAVALAFKAQEVLLPIQEAEEDATGAL